MTKAVIVGAGIAGPITAMALQAAGVDAEVYEAYDVTSEGVGAYLTLAENGLYALGQLDLRDAVQDLGFATPRMEFFSGTGKLLGRMPNGTMMRTVKRSELYSVLRTEALARGVPMHYGKRLVAATSGDGVRATFGDGTQVDADLLIGADGLHSQTRKLIDPAAPGPRYLGLLNTGGYATDIDVPGEDGVAHMIFGKRCFCCYFKNPNGEVWWFANPASATELGSAELAAISGEQWRQRLIELLAVDNTPGADIVRASAEVMRPWNTYDLPGVPTWHANRMIIVGDAAHATSPASGQGASMAIEDAVVLGKCLRDLPDVPAAFTAFERLRRERVQRIVAQGKRNGDQKAVGPVGRVIRDAMLPIVFRMMAKRGDRGNWMTEYKVDFAAPVTAG